MVSLSVCVHVCVCVCVFVCALVTIPAKMAEPIDVLFGSILAWVKGAIYLMGAI